MTPAAGALVLVCLYLVELSTLASVLTLQRRGDRLLTVFLANPAGWICVAALLALAACLIGLVAVVRRVPGPSSETARRAARRQPLLGHARLRRGGSDGARAGHARHSGWSRGRRCCRIAGPTLPRAVEPASSQRSPASPTWFPIPTSAGRSDRIDRAPITIARGSRGVWRSSGWHPRIRLWPMPAAPSIKAARRGCGARGPACRSPPCPPSVASPSWATRSRSDSRCATRTRGRTSSSARSVRSSRCSTSAGCLRKALASGFQSR